MLGFTSENHQCAVISLKGHGMSLGPGILSQTNMTTCEVSWRLCGMSFPDVSGGLPQECEGVPVLPSPPLTHRCPGESEDVFRSIQLRKAGLEMSFCEVVAV